MGLRGSQDLRSPFPIMAPEIGEYLTNRFHVAVRLFSNISQMTSKCGKTKKSGTRGVAECVTDVLTTFWRLLWSITESDLILKTFRHFKMAERKTL